MAIPSWACSLLLHGTLILLLLIFWKAPAPRGDFPGDNGDHFRDVGIRMKSEGTAEATGESTPAPAPMESLAAVTPPSAEIPFPSTMNFPAPVLSTPVMGIGPALSDAGSPHLQQLIKPSVLNDSRLQGSGRGEGIGGPPASGSAGTSFLGVDAVGKRFVYVIDRSSSMATNKALQAAKVELLSSLQRLDSSQQFQVIFYNQGVHVLDTRGSRFNVFQGTDAHRLRVTEQIRDITPAQGTHHLPAILEALKFNPDVLFLLTDGAAESVLEARDLDMIQRYNRGGTIIHCIEFGTGDRSPLVPEANFLMKLSRQNQGRYVFRNTSTVLTNRETISTPGLDN